MPTSADVLNFATQKLVPKWTEQFFQYHPVLDKIVMRGNVDKAHTGAPYLEFPVVTNGPGQVTRIETGSEVYSSVRRTVGNRGRLYCPRMIYSYIIPGKDLAEASGETAIARLLKVYPEAAMMEFHEMIVNQFVNGNGSSDNVQGFATLNGDTSYSTGSSLTENGVFGYNGYGSQTGTVFNIDKAAVSDWQNQYRTLDGSAFVTNGLGRRMMRECYWEASLQGKAGGPVDTMLGDIISYNNYYDDLDEQVRYATSFQGEKGRPVRQGLMFQEAEFYVEPSLDTSLTTFGTTNTGTGSETAYSPRADGTSRGLVYMLKSDTWHMYTLGENASMETKGDFAVRGPTKVPGQDAWEWEIVLGMQLYCDRLNANGVVTGTATLT